ncbi:glycosyltransferase family 4 protein [Erysipelothrix sp. HDW6C]|uniref:glycosyltransferase family 4 protein n=1 Tax=Erysipelothrix sp. HDW6C TaxID=2714930 RepID=UPI00140918C2|nr:glycosyltransferase family 4 protein [Erysipelothrix sp. HDW6C]QIK70037.1 glycosyltransferase family 4 protein [Erysipelothrix sp. HDW6C]
MTKKKVLFTAKVDSHIRHFHLPYIKLFHDQGYVVHVASEGDTLFQDSDAKFDISFGTNPFSRQVIESYKTLKQIMVENEYDVIHTHTAIASVLTRLAARSVNKKQAKHTRVIYTAHGFHFLKGGSKLSWILYYPIERFLARYTDDLILINQEDFDLAERHAMAKHRYLVHGVGVDLEKFKPLQRKRNTHDFTISYVAELNKNKNQILLLESVKILKAKGYELKVNLIGEGANREVLEQYITENHLRDNVSLLGYRTDVSQILDVTDLVVATSLREGLPVNIIEAMSKGLPLVVTQCRGHVDLVKNGVNGFVVPYDAEVLADRIETLMNDLPLREQFAIENLSCAKLYEIDTIVKRMSEIYFLNRD